MTFNLREFVERSVHDGWQDAIASYDMIDFARSDHCVSCEREIIDRMVFGSQGYLCPTSLRYRRRLNARTKGKHDD